MTKPKPKPAVKPKPTVKPKSKPKPVVKSKTFTTVDIANKYGMSAKTLRARIRRQADTWSPLFKDSTIHVFADNKTTWGKVDALLS